MFSSTFPLPVQGSYLVMFATAPFDPPGGAQFSIASGYPIPGVPASP